MARLRVENGPSKGLTVEVAEGPVVMGREPTCGLQILDKGASRNHSEVFRIGQMAFIRDLNSRNGTFLNDTKVNEEMLRDGDRVQIGSTVIIYEESEMAARPDGQVEFSEEGIGNAIELRLEDLTTMTVDSHAGEARLRAIYRMGRLIAAARDEKAFIHQILPFVAQELRADAAFLFTRDPLKGTILPIGTWSRENEGIGKVSRSIIRRAIQEKRALLTTDAMQDTRFSAQESILLKEIRSVICAPLSVSGDLSGVLYLAGDNPQNAFDEEELELAAAMADQVGLAINHLRLEKEQRDQLLSTVRVLVQLAEARDPSMKGRTARIEQYVLALCKELELPRIQQHNLHLSALLSGVGAAATGLETQFGIDPHRLKPGNEVENAILLTLNLLRDTSCYEQVEEAIKYQYETPAGTGPYGIDGTHLPLSARILSAARWLDTHANVYGSSGSDGLERAIDLAAHDDGSLLDPDVRDALLRADRKKELPVFNQSVDSYITQEYDFPSFADEPDREET